MTECLRCTGACMNPNGTCSSYPSGRPGGCFSSFCNCDCHKEWGSTVPPVCNCPCRMVRQEWVWSPDLTITNNSLCKHLRSINSGCQECLKEEPEKVSDKSPVVKWEDYQYLLKEKQILEGRLEKLQDDLGAAEGCIRNLEKNMDFQDHQIKRIEDMSAQSNDQFFHDELVQHEHRIKNVETILNSMDGIKEIWSAINEIRGMNHYSKIPPNPHYKCECGNDTFWLRITEIYFCYMCKSCRKTSNNKCEGKGVLWG